MKLEGINKKNIEEQTKKQEVLNSYSVQIDFHADKENSTSKQIKSLERQENKLDVEIVKSKKSGNINSNAIDKKQSTKNEKEKVLKVEELIEKVNSELHVKKYTTLGIFQYLIKKANIY
jgi:hypothetical protein